MKRVAVLPVAIAALVGVIVGMTLPSVRAQGGTVPEVREVPRPPSAKDVRGPTPYLPVENEPPPRLFVDEPLPDGLNNGIVWIQYRTENCRILPVFGKSAVNLSPRAGHLHVHVDDVPWLWADASDLNTVDIGGMPPGEHKVLIELVDPNHQVYPGQARTVKFTVPQAASHAH
jgi:hypothetical protein